MNKKQLLYIALSLIGILGLVLCGVQFVMAIRFSEVGRVVIYAVLAVFCIELTVFAGVQIFHINKIMDNA